MSDTNICTETTQESGVRLRGNRLLASPCDKDWNEDDNVTGSIVDDDLTKWRHTVRDTDQTVQVMLRSEGKYARKFLCVSREGDLVLAEKSEDAVFCKTSWIHQAARKQTAEWMVVYRHVKSNMSIAVDPGTLQVKLMRPPEDQPEGVDPRVFVEQKMGARVRLQPSICPAKFLAYDGERVLVHSDICWWEEPPADLEVDFYSNIFRQDCGQTPLGVSLDNVHKPKRESFLRTMWRKIKPGKRKQRKHTAVVSS
ncbi:hypothetical protein BaRGS_00009554 [Batillaria attramentaria]|uniref:Uncharacterized protein n=1 Tax=Batillaria attramentaria TaxID=370345 RepID=A0ABD0LID1_9CAEN